MRLDEIDFIVASNSDYLIADIEWVSMIIPILQSEMIIFFDLLKKNNTKDALGFEGIFCTKYLLLIMADKY